MTPEIVGTRFSPFFRAPVMESTAPGLLVRIYPVNHIEKPLELSDSLLLFGRDSHCSFPLSDDSVSRRHAIIERNGEEYLISDLQSMNGTYVNEERVVGSRILVSGDRVRFGNQIFKYLSADQIEAKYHEIIFNLMTTDGLTLVHNKRYLLEILERDLQQSRRDSSPLCVMMLDLDTFKSVNDTYGHMAGDAVLVEFARRAKSALRSGDLLARFGGEEFAMLLTRTNLDDAVQVAERIRHLTARTPFFFEGQLIAVTVSIGLVSNLDSMETSACDLLGQADEQLYIAKQSGRNRLCCSR